jgi:hypothetical protein
MMTYNDIPPGKALLMAENKLNAKRSSSLMLVTSNKKFYEIDMLEIRPQNDSQDLFSSNAPKTPIGIPATTLELTKPWRILIPEPQIKRKKNNALPFQVLLKKATKDKRGHFQGMLYFDRFEVPYDLEHNQVSYGDLLLPYSFLECRQEKEVKDDGWERFHLTWHICTWDPAIRFVDHNATIVTTIPEKQSLAMDLYERRLQLEKELDENLDALRAVDPRGKIADLHAQAEQRMLGAIRQS